MTTSKETIGFILAGGGSERMGGKPKGLLFIAGKPLVQHVRDRFAPQVSHIVINANLPPSAFAGIGAPVIPDRIADCTLNHERAGEGPLAGLLTCLTFAKEQTPESAWIATVPWDCPFLPLDLVSHLRDGVGDADAAIATSNGRAHPLAAVWRASLLPQLEEMFQGGLRSAKAWAARIGAKTVAFDAGPVDPFFNVNTPEDLATAEALAAKIDG